MFGGAICFYDGLPLSTSTLSPLSGQSCPATLKGACVAGTRICPVTSDGSSARGRARALTTRLAWVRGWLLFGGTQELRASHSLQSPGPRHALCTPSSPMPMQQAHLGQPGSTQIWAVGDAEPSHNNPSTLDVPNIQAISCLWTPLCHGAMGSGPCSSPPARSRPLPHAVSPSGTAWLAHKLVHAPWHPPRAAPAQLHSEDSGVPKGCRMAASTPPSPQVP